MDPTEYVEYNCCGTYICNSHVDDHGWTKVVSRRRNRNKNPADDGASGKIVLNGPQILMPKIVSADVEDESNGAGAARSKRLSNSFGDENAASNENLKAKKTRKSIVSLSEAAAEIDNARLAALLSESLKSYAVQPDTQLLRFMEHIASETPEVQFPWLKMFPLKAPWRKLTDVINHNKEGTKPGKIGEQLASPKPQVVIFVTLAMALRSKPSALTSALRPLRNRRSLQGQDKLPLTVWMMAQAAQGSCIVGLYAWARNLLPLVGNKNSNPQSRDLILQLVEKILSDPKARTALMNRAVKKGVRVIPPPSFEILLRLTFPSSSARVKATERFEAIYPFLKEVALAGEPGSKAMKQVIQQIFPISLKLAGEGNPALAEEATAIAIWCVTEYVGICKLWDSLYKNNLEASAAVLKKLVDKWKDHSLILSSSIRNTHTLSRVMKSFRLKNKEAIAEKEANDSLYKEADKTCKVILWRLSLGSCKRYCFKATTITAVVLAVAGAAVLSSNVVATPELKNLVDLYINAITTAFKN